MHRVKLGAGEKLLPYNRIRLLYVNHFALSMLIFEQNQQHKNAWSSRNIAYLIGEKCDFPRI